MIVSRFDPQGEIFAGVAMRTIMLVGALVGLVVLAHFGISARLPSEHRAADAAQQRDVGERFAIKYCYGQYRNQTDVDRCLMRNTQLAAGQSRWETRHLGSTRQ